MAEILQYIPGSGLFHQLHPGTKILFIILVSIITIITTSIAVLIALLLVLFILALAGHLFKPVIQQMVLVVFMSVILYLITIVTVPEGTIVGYLIHRGEPSHHSRGPYGGNRAYPEICNPYHCIPALCHLHAAT
jgi:energy-coupling factor transport system permease protein